MIYIGIDLGTSSVKLLAMDETGAVLHAVSREYPVYYPRPGWSEQHPEDWFSKTEDALAELLTKIDRSRVRGIGVGGQMHGLVMLDKADAVIRPAILWNDGRTDFETEFLNEAIGRKRIAGYTGNIAFAGFTAPKLLWVKKNEPEHFRRISKIMLPKDYIVYRLTGVHATDYSDASGTLLLDVRQKQWSKKMLEICGMEEEALPRLLESYEAAGELSPALCERFGLSGVAVAAGAGDNAAAAIGTGTAGDGACNLSVGTSGTVFICSDTFRMDQNNALHAFAHADGRFHLMGCILSAASAGKWWVKDILGAGYPEEERGMAPAGGNNLFFLPYLMGERSPHNDPDARGCLIGAGINTTRGDILQAVYEGVAFALRDSVEIAAAEGIRIERTKICGGGAKSGVWRGIIADVLNLPVDVPENEEGPALGGAILAAAAAGEFGDAAAESRRIAKIRDTVVPNPAAAARYEEKYQIYRSLYPALKQVFKSMKQ